MNDISNPLEMAPIERLDWPRHADGVLPILVCVQFDETGANALRYARLLSAVHGRAPLHVTHVVTEASQSGRGAVISRHTKALERAQTELAAFAAEHLGEGANTHLHVRMGDAVETVLQLAYDYDAELIVVGTHGRSGVKKMAFGSVAQRLVETARCPVLIAAPRDFSGMSLTLIPDPAIEGHSGQ